MGPTDGKYYRCKFTAFDGKDVTILHDTTTMRDVALAVSCTTPSIPRPMSTAPSPLFGRVPPSRSDSSRRTKSTDRRTAEVEELAKIQQKLESFLNDECYLLDDLDGFKLGLLFGGRYFMRCTLPEGGSVDKL